MDRTLHRATLRHRLRPLPRRRRPPRPAERRRSAERSPDAVATRLASLEPDVLVSFEASSGCDGLLIGALAGRGLAFSRTDPRQVPEFTTATGVLARTDRVDARVLAETGFVLDLPITVPSSPPRRRSSDFRRRRRHLVEIRKAETTRRCSAGQDEVAARIEAMIGLVTRQVAALDRAIGGLIEEDRSLSRHARLRSVAPGIGPPVLAILPGDLPERGSLDRRRSALSPALHHTLARAGGGVVYGGSGAVAARPARRSPPRDVPAAPS